MKYCIFSTDVWVMGGKLLSDGGTLALPHIVKRKACKSALQAILIGQAKREPGRFPGPTLCSMEAAVLVGSHAL